MPLRFDRTDPWRTAVLRIRDDKTLQLINECKNAQCLWNTKLPDYPNKEARMVAYHDIAAKLDIPNFTARHVSVKFKNLRNSYCQELKKMVKDQEYSPKVFWFEVMDEFLKPHLQRQKSYKEKTKLLLAPKHNLDDTNTDSGEPADATDWAIEYSHSDGSCSNSNCESTFVDQANCTQETLGDLRAKKRKLSDCLSEGEHVEIKQSYSDIDIEEHPLPSPDDLPTEVNGIKMEQEMTTERPKEVVPSAVCPKDCYDAFGSYIASLLRTLPPKKALMLQPKIVDMVVSVGLEGFNDGGS